MWDSQFFIFYQKENQTLQKQRDNNLTISEIKIYKIPSTVQTVILPLYHFAHQDHAF